MEPLVDLKRNTHLGASPEATVAAVISKALKEGDSELVRVGRGIYWLKQEQQQVGEIEDDVEPGSLEAYGLYWDRAKVRWRAQTALYGQVSPKSVPVNVAEQNGVYLLYNEHGELVYVGETMRPLAKRLREHTEDCLAARWSKFSWFGIRPVAQNGELKAVAAVSADSERLVKTLEALLIQAFEPRLNRKGGETAARGTEFFQISSA